MLAYCKKSYPVGVGALDDIDNVPLSLWQQSKQLKFRVRLGAPFAKALCKRNIGFDRQDSAAQTGCWAGL